MKSADLIHDELNVAYQALYNVEHQIRVQLAAEINASTGTTPTRKEHWLKQALKELKTANTFLTRTGSAHNSAFYFSEETE